MGRLVPSRVPLLQSNATIMTKRNAKAKPKEPVDLPAYRADLIKRHTEISARLQQAQATITQLIGELNQNGGSLVAVNRMLGKADNDGAL